jgi:GT2 family glycosyltransferase
MSTSVSAIVVAWRHDPAAIARLVEALAAQAQEVIVVDNEPAAPVATALAGSAARTLRPGRNLGYAAGCNAAAAEARGEWLFFVNPDAEVAPDVVERLLEAADDRTAVVGAQVLLPDGERVNAGDNPLHVCGMSWSGRYLEAREDGPPRPVAVASGAALLVRRSDFDALGRFQPDYFAYQDDVDLAWRARLAGRRVLFCPRAIVRHDYEFAKGDYKWFLLERNRLWTVLSCYSAPALALLAPLLLGAEAAVLAVAVRGGWWREKLRAWRAIWRGRAELRRWRAEVQARRRVPDAEILEAMTGAFETPLMRAPLVEAFNPLLDAWRRAAILALRCAARASGGRAAS